MPRDHVAAAWISHESWRTDPGAAPGTRNAGVDQARVFESYLDRWDLLDEPTHTAPVLLPEHYRDLALTDRVGLPPEHPWRLAMPD